MEHPSHPLLLLKLPASCPNTPSSLYTDFWACAAGQVPSLSLFPRKCNNVLRSSRKWSLEVFLRKGGRSGRRERNRGDRGECPQDTAGLGWGRCSRQRWARLPAVPEHRPRSRRSRSSGAGSGTRPPPSGTRAPRDRQVPGKHTPITAARRETGLVPLCQQEGDGEDADGEPLRASPGSLRQPGSSLLIIVNRVRTQMTGKLVGRQVRLLRS